MKGFVSLQNVDLALIIYCSFNSGNMFCLLYYFRILGYFYVLCVKSENQEDAIYL